MRKAATKKRPARRTKKSWSWKSLFAPFLLVVIFCLSVIYVMKMNGTMGSVLATTVQEGAFSRQMNENVSTKNITETYYLTTSTGKIYVLTASGTLLTTLKNTTSGSTMRVEGTLGTSTIKLSSSYLPLITASKITVLANKSMTTYTSSTTRRVGVIMFNFTDDKSQPYTKATVLDKIYNGTKSLKAFYSQASLGKLNITGYNTDPSKDIFGWVTINMPNDNCDEQFLNWAKAAKDTAYAQGYRDGNYDHVILIFPVTPCSFQVKGDLGGRHIWSAGKIEGVAHEFGHNIGWNHANAMNCTLSGAGSQRVALSSYCTNVEYGDPSDLMGGSAYVPRFPNGIYAHHAGWFGTGDVKDIAWGAWGTYTISYRGDPSKSLNNFKALRLPRDAAGSEYIYVELRQNIGDFDIFPANDTFTTGVSVRTTSKLQFNQFTFLVDTTPETTSFSDAPLQPGKTMLDNKSGIKITLLSVQYGKARIEVKFP